MKGIRERKCAWEKMSIKCKGENCQTKYEWGKWSKIGSKRKLAVWADFKIKSNCQLGQSL